MANIMQMIHVFFMTTLRYASPSALHLHWYKANLNYSPQIWFKRFRKCHTLFRQCM